METTTAGAVATVAMPLGSIHRRTRPAPYPTIPPQRKVVKNAKPRS
jgi:hypothetical protein